MKRQAYKKDLTTRRSVLARARGRSRLCGMRGFTLVEVQVAIVIFGFGMVAFLGYTRVNGALIRAAEETRSVDGYADLAQERAIVIIASEPGTIATPPCDLQLQDIDESGLYPVVELTVARSTP